MSSPHARLLANEQYKQTAEVLTSLTVLLGATTAKKVSQWLERQHSKDPMRGLREATMWELTEQAKIPACKVDIIKAALNLGKRAWLDATPIMSNLSSPEAAARVFSWHLAKLPVEKIAVACLNSQNEALSVEVLSVGTASECLCDAKIIFRHIIQSGATRWMLAHNHPSFSPDPSPEDLKLTEGLLQASQTIYLPLMDHIIIGDGTFTSLRSTTSLWQQFPQGD